MRAFLAVPVAAPAHAAVGHLLQRLDSRVGGVRWVDPATVHLTLHFFADLAGERLDDVVGVVRTLAASTAPFPLSLGGLGSFPPRGRPRVLWLGVAEPAPPLNWLAGRVEDVLDRNGFEVERRPYSAHVTLGRPRPTFDLEAWREEMGEPTILPGFTAAEIILHESAGGHHVRARLPLQG
jgi:RNA 2',3'-cyclic 3'-phosphodiesterase